MKKKSSTFLKGLLICSTVAFLLAFSWLVYGSFSAEQRYRESIESGTQMYREIIDFSGQKNFYVLDVTEIVSKYLPLNYTRDEFVTFLNQEGFEIFQTAKPSGQRVISGEKAVPAFLKRQIIQINLNLGSSPNPKLSAYVSNTTL